MSRSWQGAATSTRLPLKVSRSSLRRDELRAQERRALHDRLDVAQKQPRLLTRVRDRDGPARLASGDLVEVGSEEQVVREEAGGGVCLPALPAGERDRGRVVLDQLQEFALPGVELHPEQAPVLARLQEPDRATRQSPLAPYSASM